MKQTKGAGRVRAAVFAQRGLSLIELMVSVVISLLIMVAILQLYLDISRTNEDMAQTNAQIENGRFTIQLLQNDIAHAGFWGGYVPEFDDLTTSDTPVSVTAGDPPETVTLVQRTPRVVPDPCSQDSTAWSQDEKDALLGIPVQAFGAALTDCSMTGKVSGTDVLVVRYAGLTPVAVSELDCDDDPTTPAPPCSAFFQTTFCEDEMPAYRLDAVAVNTMRFKDCLTPTNTTTADFPETAVRRLVSNIYWIKDVDSVPTLMRQEFGGNAQPLIEGIEAFRVELGVDNVSKTGEAVDYSESVAFSSEDDRSTPTNRGDGVPDTFVRCPADGCTAEQLRNVVAVKLFVLVRSLRETPGYTDPKTYCLESPELNADADCSSDALFEPDAGEKKFKRHLFSSTVRLANVAGRRETP